LLAENTYCKPLLSSAKSGPQLVTISNVTKYKNNLGEIVKRKGKEGVVVTFSGDIQHEELYWIGGVGYSKLLRLMTLVDVPMQMNTHNPLMAESFNFFNTKDMVNKSLWIVIRHNILMQGDREVKRESEIIDYSPEDKKPNYAELLEEYDIAAIGN